ncbi:MAG: hypothetical protein ACKVQR_24155, partial [Aquabacterium sp.]
MSTTDPLADALRTLSSMATGLPGAAALAPSPLDPVLTQAHMIGSMSLMRSGQRASQSWLDYTRAAATAADLPARVDAARAHLRRLAEISADEARQVTSQMLALDE